MAWCRRPRGVALPGGIRPLPGPAVVVGERHQTSPVGRYTALAIGVPARLGLRPGVCFLTMVVDSNDRRIAGRLNWGLPGEVGTLHWDAGPAGVALDWVEGGVRVSAESRGAPFPWILPMRALQQRADGPVVVPFRTLGRARAARVTVTVPEGDELAWAAGEHPGLRVSGLRLRIHPARTPSGLVSSLRAPLTAIEPGISFVPVDTATPAGSPPVARRYDDGPRAYGSVG